MPRVVETILSALALGLELVGAGIIVATAVVALWLLGGQVLRRRPLEWSTGRQSLGRGLILGLEYLIGADILKTIIAPELRELVALGAVIILRTVLSLSIEFELRHAGDQTPSSKRE